MNPPAVWLGAVPVSYLVGSIPTAYVACRLLKGDDIRNLGSGNVGATNALRVLGKGPGAAVLLFDVLKGVAAVLLVPALFGDAEPLLRVFCGLAAVTGHSWTVFLRFRGGKGAATGLGCVFGMMPEVAACVLAVWLAVLLASRYVSLGSVVAALSAPLFMGLFREPAPYFAFGVLAALLVLVRHRSNIRRLIKGTERKIGKKE